MAYLRDITADDQVFYDTDLVLHYTVYQSDATPETIAANTAIPQDVTGWAIGWTLRKKTSSADPPLIEKTTESGGGIVIDGTYNADPDLNTQRLVVTLEDTDTYDPEVSPVVQIKPGNYVYALKRLDEGSETILAAGRLRLLQAAAWE
jgi:hypothetical protein